MSASECMLIQHIVSYCIDTAVSCRTVIIRCWQGRWGSCTYRPVAILRAEWAERNAESRRPAIPVPPLALQYQINTRSFNGPLSGTTRASRYQKGKANLDFTEERDSEWQWHQLGHMQICTLLEKTTTPALHHSVFLEAGCPSCRPTNSIKALQYTDQHVNLCPLKKAPLQNCPLLLQGKTGLGLGVI